DGRDPAGRLEARRRGDRSRRARGRHDGVHAPPALPALGKARLVCRNRGQSLVVKAAGHDPGREMSPTGDRRWLTLAIVGAAFFMTVLDVAIVNVAIPSIKNDLNISESSVQWVITAYAITFGGFLLLGGRMADLLGRRRIFIVGLTIFTVASLVCGLANVAWLLFTARAVQGVGAAIISPAALSIVTTTFEEGAERNKALGSWGALGGSGAAAGG